ncbi:MAG: D-TA family PLP-dependent enzyme [Pseudomonadota bacterium]
MDHTALKQDITNTFGSPVAVIDLDKVDANIARLQTLCDQAGVQNRPHIKTHKIPSLAKKQIAAGASGITCQKLGEAEIMAADGLDNILISYNLLGAEKMGRLGTLARDIDITVTADNPVVVAGLPEAARIAGRPVNVAVECDTGMKRAGVETAAEAITLARDIAARPELNFRGFMFYPTTEAWPQTQAFFDEASAGLAESGLEAEIVSTGGTPNLTNLGRLDGATEHRSGTSIFNDRMMMACGAATLDDCALEIYATVVSRAGPERGILDSGSKTLTSDTGGLDGFGYIREYPDARIKGFSEEHGFLDLSACEAKPEVGEIVRVIPNHVCVVVNMVDRLIGVRDGKIVEELPVVARGKIS